MGILDCLTCWSTFPCPKKEKYDTIDNITDDCVYDTLVEKLLVIGVPYSVLCPGLDERCKKQLEEPTNKISDKNQSKTQSIISVEPLKVATATINFSRGMNINRHKRKAESSDETTEDDEDDEPVDEADYSKSIRSRSSHRSELNDERPLVSDTIKINQTASGAEIIIPNPKTYEEKYYRDFILKYGSIFIENLKDPIPKDPNPVNPSNIVKLNPLNLPSTSQKKESKIKGVKQVHIGPVSSIDLSTSSKQDVNKTQMKDISETEMSSVEGDDDGSDRSYISVIDRYTQTMGESFNKLLPPNFTQDTRNITIAQSSLSNTTTTSEEQQLHSKNRVERFILDGPEEIEVEDTSVTNRGKKALRWKIIIRHQHPSTVQAESMTDERFYSEHKNTATDSSASTDSGYLQYDYVDD